MVDPKEDVCGTSTIPWMLRAADPVQNRLWCGDSLPVRSAWLRRIAGSGVSGGNGRNGLREAGEEFEPENLRGASGRTPWWRGHLPLEAGWMPVFSVWGGHLNTDAAHGQPADRCPSLSWEWSAPSRPTRRASSGFIQDEWFRSAGNGSVDAMLKPSLLRQPRIHPLGTQP